MNIRGDFLGSPHDTNITGVVCKKNGKRKLFIHDVFAASCVNLNPVSVQSFTLKDLLYTPLILCLGHGRAICLIYFRCMMETHRLDYTVEQTLQRLLN